MNIRLARKGDLLTINEIYNQAVLRRSSTAHLVPVAILLDRNLARIHLLEKYGFVKWGALPGIARIGPHQADHVYYGLKL